MAPPPNDDFANAEVIVGSSGAPGAVVIDEATTEASEPLTPGTIRQTIWYKWTAPHDGTAQFYIDPELTGGRFGYMSLWTGASLGTLVSASFLTSQPSGSESDALCVTVASGTDYYVQCGIDAVGGAGTGTLAMRWVFTDPPTNDDFANRIGLSGAAGSVVTQFIDSATIEVGEQFGVGPDPGFQTVWYEWTAPADGLATFVVQPNAFAYTFAVYNGLPSLAGMTFVAGDAGGSPTAFSVIEGVTYYLQVGTFGDDCNRQWTISWIATSPATPANIRFSDPPLWRLFVTDINSRVLSILDHRVTDRQFMYVLNGPAYHTGQVASDDQEINLPFPNADSPANLSHNLRFIYALRREMGASPPYVCRFAGILMQPEDQGTDAPTTRYTAFDPWQYMFNRPARNPETGALLGRIGYIYKAGTRASTIATDMLSTTLAVDGETFITVGTITPTDPLAVDFTIDAGLSVGEVWQNLALTGTIDIYLAPIYEPITDPGKLCRLEIEPFKGDVQFDAVMAWDKPGNSLTSISRLVDGTRMANFIRDYSGQGGYPVPIQTDAASVASYGTYWAQQYFPQANNQVLVELAAFADLQIRRNGQRTISFDPTPERSVLELRDYGLGDYLPVWASRNLREPLEVDYDAYLLDPDFPGAAGYQRVYAIPVTLDDAGVARVTGLVTSKDSAVG
jgi:hypothetical protein